MSLLRSYDYDRRTYLNEQIIRLAGDNRIMHQERTRTPQIPREDDTGRFAVFRYGQLQESGAEDMAGVL